MASDDAPNGQRSDVARSPTVATLQRNRASSAAAMIEGKRQPRPPCSSELCGTWGKRSTGDDLRRDADHLGPVPNVTAAFRQHLDVLAVAGDGGLSAVTFAHGFGPFERMRVALASTGVRRFPLAQAGSTRAHLFRTMAHAPTDPEAPTIG